MIRVAIAEDIHRISLALQEKIALSADFEVKTAQPNGKALIQALQKDHNVDVILMDINMPEMNGIEATEKVTSLWPNIKVIMMTVFNDQQSIFEAILAGATGYLLKDESPGKIHKSLFEVMEGGAPMSPEIALKSLSLVRQAPTLPEVNIAEEHQLTKRETEVLEHLVQGLSYAQIADRLFISHGTVRKHVENVYRKLKVHGKVEAIKKVSKRGFL